MSELKNYKETLNLPQTSFAMKANLAQREPEMLKAWEGQNLYASVRRRSAGKKKYILHDGPPYANGHIHIGHALNKILKDVIVKYRTLRGYDSLYIPGWDCHGLPIEHQCLKDMGKRKEEVERVSFRKQARKYAEKFIQIQREEFKRLGIFAEWDNPYLTMNYSYQASIAESFLGLVKRGYIYQGMKPVPWCFDCETALADAELEYEDKISKSVYVKFPVDIESLKTRMKLPSELAGKPVYLLVWTTTPWTLPANVGAAVHPDLEYSLLEVNGEVWLLADARTGHLQEMGLAAGARSTGVHAQGKALKGLIYQHPFIDRKGRTILADYVSATDGTGIVHIAPGHGEEDYQFGHVENGLEVLSPVDEKGRFTEAFEPCKGMHVFKSNEPIVEILKQKNLLIAEEAHPHSYPHCWRCKKPILFRATKQWFMKIDHSDLRQKMLRAIKDEIQFVPDWGKNRIGTMVETRPEWCLSRQRYWGVPIPMIRCSSCEGHYFPEASEKKIVSIFEQEGADSWFARPAEDFLPENFICPQCHGKHFVKEEDIIDVWFDSGVSHQAVLRKNPGLEFPASLYLEGSDQHRGWFQSSLTTATALEGCPPFKSVLTHGFVMDGEGRKMSKSAGNVVSPQEVMKEFGADILRLWVSSCDYQFDVRLSKGILNQLADSYRKIRNTFRYMLSNLYDFNPAKDKLALKDLHLLDQWAIRVTGELVDDIARKYERFEFHEIYQEVHHFCVIHLSSYYFDVLKDTLYTARKDSFLRRSAQTAIFFMLSRLVKILAPILPFTMDEVWKAFPIEEGIASVHESLWDEHLGGDGSHSMEAQAFLEWSDIRSARNAVTIPIEKKREAGALGASLDAKLLICAENDVLKKLFSKYEKDLRRIFIVSQVELVSTPVGEMEEVKFESVLIPGEATFRVSVQKAEGAKCVRCWNYSTVVGTHAEHPGLCEKCLEAVR